MRFEGIGGYHQVVYLQSVMVVVRLVRMGRNGAVKSQSVGKTTQDIFYTLLCSGTSPPPAAERHANANSPLVNSRRKQVLAGCLCGGEGRAGHVVRSVPVGGVLQSGFRFIKKKYRTKGYDRQGGLRSTPLL